MLKTIIATRFIRKLNNGRTLPTLIECEDEHGVAIEVVAKCSAGCMEGERNLAIEAISAMLAADLDLPVPEPFVIQLDDEFIESVLDNDVKNGYRKSCRLAFGSRFLPPGFAVWSEGQIIPKELTQEAAEIFVFDALIVNPDRRPQNPNCLYTGKEVAIFDHELALAQHQLILWKAPWVEGGFDGLSNKSQHIFSYSYFETRPTQLDRFIAVWEALDDNRFDEYKNAIPVEWEVDEEFIDTIVNYLKDVKSNIKDVAINALKVLS